MMHRAIFERRERSVLEVWRTALSGIGFFLQTLILSKHVRLILLMSQAICTGTCVLCNVWKLETIRSSERNAFRLPRPILSVHKGSVTFYFKATWFNFCHLFFPLRRSKREREKEGTHSSPNVRFHISHVIYVYISPLPSYIWVSFMQVYFGAAAEMLAEAATPASCTWPEPDRMLPTCSA